MSIDSCQKPRRVNVCDGMCSACGADGAILRVAPRRLERPWRQRGHVVAVDDVVREPGMVGLLGEQRFEDRARLQQVGVGLVGRHPPAALKASA